MISLGDGSEDEEERRFCVRPAENLEDGFRSSGSEDRKWGCSELFKAGRSKNLLPLRRTSSHYEEPSPLLRRSRPHPIFRSIFVPIFDAENRRRENCSIFETEDRRLKIEGILHSSEPQVEDGRRFFALRGRRSKIMGLFEDGRASSKQRGYSIFRLRRTKSPPPSSIFGTKI